MITFKWLRGGTFQVLKDGEGIGVFNPSTKKDSKVSFDSKFTGDKDKEKNKIGTQRCGAVATADSGWQLWLPARICGFVYAAKYNSCFSNGVRTPRPRCSRLVL